MRRRQTAQREDDAYLAVAYTRHTLRWMAWTPAWFIPLLLVVGYVINLIFYRDFGIAVDETVDSSLVTGLFLGVVLPLIHIVKLQRAEQQNVDALWRMHSEGREVSADSRPEEARPLTGTRG